MKKYVLLTLLVILVVLSSCPGGPKSRQDTKNEDQIWRSGWDTTVRPQPLATSDEIIKYDDDGSIIMGVITFPTGIKWNLKWMPLTIRSKGAATEAYNNEYDLLIAIETEVIKNNPQDIGAYIRRASLFVDRGRNTEDFQNAINDCDEVLKINKNESAAYYIRGFASFLLEDNDGALSDFTTIVNIREYMNRGINFLIAQIYIKKDMVSSAIEMLEKVVKVDPDFPYAVGLLERLRSR